MDQQIKLLIAKAEDAVRLCRLRNSPKFWGFLSPGEQTVIASSVKGEGTRFYGGYDDAERRMFGALPDYIDDVSSSFPIVAINFSYPSSYKLSHRDVLGSVMATGINREKVGDIRFGDGLAVVLVADDIANYLKEQIKKIGNVGVVAEITPVGEALSFLPPPSTVPLNFTVSSPRLDAIVSGLTGCGRSKAELMISDGLVFVNSFEVSKVTKQIKAGDKITLRGIGKFEITGSGSFSKKGREIITAKKYI